MNVIPMPAAATHTKRRKKKRQRVLNDILHCLVYLERQADRAGFAEVADLIGIARLAGRDAMDESGKPRAN